MIVKVKPIDDLAQSDKAVHLLSMVVIEVGKTSPFWQVEVAPRLTSSNNARTPELVAARA